MENDKWTKIPDKDVIEKTIAALKEGGINAYFAENEEEARKKVFEIVPQGAEIMNMTSVTLDGLGISNEILKSERYNAVKNKLNKMDRKMQGREIERLGAAPEYAIGSVHAVTEDGKILIASATGSQLPAYAYGAEHVIFVVGAQKIVKNIDEAMKRIYEHSLLLESERAKKAYGVEGSSVNKILIVNKEFKEGRIDLIFVNKVLGF